jgi:hypothetical protein
MQQFKCRRCNYETQYKCAYLKHLERKVPCEITNENISIQELLLQIKKVNTETPYKCEYCGKYFNQSQGKYQHRQRCKQKPLSIEERLDELQNKVDYLENKNKELENIVHNNGASSSIIINNGTINQNNVFVLQNFGSETEDHITQDFIKYCIMNNVSGMKSLIERIHFSDDAPQNKNVRLKSLKNNLVEVHNNNQWIVKDVQDATETMIRKGCNIFNAYYLDNDNGIRDQDINILENKIQMFLTEIMGRNGNAYFALRRRILALIIEHSNYN